MFDKLQIRNFRVFDNLQISELDRINLVAGCNNSGKTTLLEALFLLSGGDNAQLALNVSAFRGVDSAAGTAATVGDILWKPLFFALDTKKTIEISGHHRALGALALKILPAPPGTIELPLDAPGPTGIARPAGANELVFSFEGAPGGGKVESRIRVTGPAIQIAPSNSAVPVHAVFLSSRTGNLHEDATRLGQLRRRKQGDMVAEALRIIEPRLKSVEDNTASGQPMIWGDIGLSELVPLPTMGEGMTRIARLVLAIATTSGGVVLADEIENGLHHAVLPDVWRVVERAARQFDVQVVATTHSFECVEAAHHALDKSGFRLHRLEAGDDGCRCVTYRPEAVDAAIRHRLEVR